MSYIVLAWGLVFGMCAWALYLYFAWAGVDTLPMQWSITGKPTWFATRGAAVAIFPLLAIFVVGFTTYASRPHQSGAGMLLTSTLLFAGQALWVFLARKYV